MICFITTFLLLKTEFGKRWVMVHSVSVVSLRVIEDATAQELPSKKHKFKKAGDDLFPGISFIRS